MNDCWHFITNDGFIFTTRGNIHSKGFVLAIGIYYPDKNGERIYDGKIYLKKIDEFGEEWIKINHPEYIVQNEKGIQIIVPLKDIKKNFDPFKITKKNRETMNKTKWKELIKILEELIPKEDIGFIGSYLIGFQTEKSDIDIVIRGIDNLKKIKENFGYILKKLNATNKLDNYLTEISLKKYYNFYSKEKNDFSKMIENRWATIRTSEYMTKLRFIPNKYEIKFPEIKNKITDFEINGKVIDDFGTNFMPRFFKITTGNKEYSVLTYFWDYTYCVKIGDKVTINGSLFEKDIIVINNRKRHGVKFN